MSADMIEPPKGPPRVILHLLDLQDEAIASYPIDSARITLGRQSSCDVRINAAAVSKLHASIDLIEHTLVVHSANAVQVRSADGRTQSLRRDEEPLPLANNTRLTIAGRVFVYEICCQLDELSDQSIDMAVVNAAVIDTPAQQPRALRRSPRRSDASMDIPLPDDSFDLQTGPYEDTVRRLVLCASSRAQTVPLALGDSDDEAGSSSDIPPPLSATDGNETSDEEVESLLVSPQVAAGIPLPDSPPSASSPALDQRIPSSAPTRRLSLRERLLVRTAISAHMIRSNSQDNISARPPSPSPLAHRQAQQLIGSPSSAARELEPEPVSVFDFEVEEVPIVMAEEPPAQEADTPVDEEAFADAPDEAAAAVQLAPSPSPPRAPEPVVAASAANLTPVRPRRSARLSAESARSSPAASPSPPRDEERRFKHSRLTPRKSSLKTPGGTPQASPDEKPKSVKKTLKRKVSFHETIAMVEIPHRTESEAEILSPVKRPRIESSGPLTDKSMFVSLPAPDQMADAPIASTSTLPEPPTVQLPSDLLFSPGKQTEVSDMLDSLSSKPARTPSRARRSPTKQPPLVVQQALQDMQQPESSTQRSLPPPRRSPVKPLAELLKSPAPKLGSRPMPPAQAPATVQAPRAAKLMATVQGWTSRRSSLPSEQATATTTTQDVFAALSSTSFAPRLLGLPSFSFFPTTPVKAVEAPVEPITFSPEAFAGPSKIAIDEPIEVKSVEEEPVVQVEPVQSSSPTPEPVVEVAEPVVEAPKIVKASRLPLTATATIGSSKSSAIPKARRAAGPNTPVELATTTTTTARRTTRATRSATAASTDPSTTTTTTRAPSRAVKSTAAGRKASSSAAITKGVDASPTASRKAAATTTSKTSGSRSDKENDGGPAVAAPAVSRSGRPLRTRSTIR